MKGYYDVEEIMFYVDILCQHHNITRKDIRQLVQLFNEVLELPIDYIELQEIIFSPSTYMEKRQMIKMY